MRWIVKAAAQRIIGALPADHTVNYWFQRRVTKNLPRSQHDFDNHVMEGAKHLDAFKRHVSDDLSVAQLYEFGAGWDLIGPLTSYALGAEHQTLVDLRANLRFELIDHALGTLNSRREELEQELGKRLRAFDPRPITGLSDLYDRFGITYLAPRDARDTGLPGDSFDLISSTFTLEHIPRDDIQAILHESARLLTPTGIISFSVDMQDHYSYFDSKLSPYNFLKFSPRTWRLINSPIHYQNRLRLPDYLEMFSRAGLKTLEQKVHRPSTEEVSTLRGLRVSDTFSDYSEADLGALALHVVARRQ